MSSSFLSICSVAGVELLDPIAALSAAGPAGFLDSPMHLDFFFGWVPHSRVGFLHGMDRNSCVGLQAALPNSSAGSPGFLDP